MDFFSTTLIRSEGGIVEQRHGLLQDVRVGRFRIKRRQCSDGCPGLDRRTRRSAVDLIQSIKGHLTWSLIISRAASILELEEQRRQTMRREVSG